MTNPYISWYSSSKTSIDWYKNIAWLTIELALVYGDVPADNNTSYNRQILDMADDEIDKFRL